MQSKSMSMYSFAAASVLATLSLVICPLSVARTEDPKTGTSTQSPAGHDPTPKFQAAANPASTQEAPAASGEEMKPGERSQTDLFVPLLGSGGQENRSSWSTSLWVHNLDSTTAKVQFFLLKINQSNQIPAVYNDIIPPGTTRRYDRAGETLFDEAGACVLRVVSDRNLVVRSRLESMAREEKVAGNLKGEDQKAEGMQEAGSSERPSTTNHPVLTDYEALRRQFFAAVPARFAIAAGDKIKLLGVYQPNLQSGRWTSDPGLGTGVPPRTSDSSNSFPVGLVETTGETVTVKVTAIDESGGALASKDFQLTGFEPRPYDLRDFLSGSDAARVKLEVEVMSGLGKVIAFGSGLAQDPTAPEKVDTGLHHEAAIDNEGKSAKLDGKLRASQTLSPAQRGLQGGSVTGSGAVGRVPVWRGNNVLGSSAISVSSEGEVASVSIDGALDGNARLAVYGLGLTAARGLATAGIGVEGQSESNYGVRGISQKLDGVIGLSDTRSGVYGGGKTEGVLGRTTEGIGVRGESDSFTGVSGESSSGVGVEGASKSNTGVEGTSTSGIGVAGIGKTNSGVEGNSDSGAGVKGVSTSGAGLEGNSSSGVGVKGKSSGSTGVMGESSSGRGVHGKSTGSGDGVFGESASGAGLHGKSSGSGDGVFGEGASGPGVHGKSTGSGDGVFGESASGTALHGKSSGSGDAIFGEGSSGPGLHGKSTGGVGVLGESDTGRGVEGHSKTKGGVVGISDEAAGVGGMSTSNVGVAGQSKGTAGVEGTGEQGSTDGVRGLALGSGRGVYGKSSGSGDAVFGEGSNGGTGLHGKSSGSGNGVLGESTSGLGVSGTSKSSSGVEGDSMSGVGVFGSSETNSGVEGASMNKAGVRGTSMSFVAVRGDSPADAFGVQGSSKSSLGVAGFSTSKYGVQGSSESNVGVFGASHGTAAVGSTGVYGTCDGCFGVYGASKASIGMFGTSETFVGVRGEGEFGVVGVRTVGRGFYGMVAACTELPCKAAQFNGSIETTGVKLFHIDHPLDPANKYLNHASIESSEVKNLYDGVAVLDSLGEAVVILPRWFEALNKDFRYQLTAVGAPGPSLYVSEEIKNNRFKIAGGMLGMKVSWQVTGNRQDAYAEAYPMEVEEEKSGIEQGHYLNPELFGQPQDKSVLWLHHPDLLRRIQEKNQPAEHRDSEVMKLETHLPR